MSERKSISEETKERLEKALAYLKSDKDAWKTINQKIGSLINDEILSFEIGIAFIAANRAIDITVPETFPKKIFYIAFLLAALLKIIES